MVLDETFSQSLTLHIEKIFLDASLVAVDHSIDKRHWSYASIALTGYFYSG